MHLARSVAHEAQIYSQEMYRVLLLENLVYFRQTWLAIMAEINNLMFLFLAFWDYIIKYGTTLKFNFYYFYYLICTRNLMELMVILKKDISKLLNI